MRRVKETFSIYKQLTVNLSKKRCRWLDYNPGPMASETTTLSTLPQPRLCFLSLFFSQSHIEPFFFSKSPLGWNTQSPLVSFRVRKSLIHFCLDWNWPKATDPSVRSSKYIFRLFKEFVLVKKICSTNLEESHLGKWGVESTLDPEPMSSFFIV